MPPLPKRWLLRTTSQSIPPELFPRFDPLTASVLLNRGITSAQEADVFVGQPIDAADPFALQGMGVAVERLVRALEGDEPIVVYGDFDVDGICATALLVETLNALGGNVRHYIPRRVEEGYGLLDEALRDLANAGVALILTVDCGIRSIDEVDLARSLGMDVVITDHHAVGPRLPAAVAAINPKRTDDRSMYRQLSGVGVAYRLAQALLRSCGNGKSTRNPSGLVAEDLLDLVALGTVADMVPLTGENRSLVRLGLERINRAVRPGIGALMQRAGLDAGAVDAEAIGFGLGPRINAAGRLDSADTAYELLMARSSARATDLAQQLDAFNRKRQELTREFVNRGRPEARIQVASSPLVFVEAPDLPLGMIGLIAGRLADEFYRPAVVVRRGEEFSRGSARSIDEFHVTNALDQCADLLVKHGGHAAAAGFTVKSDRLGALEERLRELAAKELEGTELAPKVEIDVEVDLAQVSEGLIEELNLLEPYGCGNDRPTFLSRDVRVLENRRVGRGGNHLKLTLLAGNGTWDGIAFRLGEWSGTDLRRMDIVYRPEFNDWRGTRSVQLNIQDLRPAGSGRPVEPMWADWDATMDAEE